MANLQSLKPFKKGYDPRRYVKQKGDRSFETDLKIATKEIAEALKLGKEPNKVYVQLIITGLKEALKGNFFFWNKFMQTLYKEMREKYGLDLTSGGEPMGVIFLPRRKQDENKQLKEPEKNGLETPTKTGNSTQ